ncbi:MAG: CubicO group peptidase (beta-lactamase class C family) [Candidatus Azotimanducaceae bacterium]|jgi:CubicO group peptidase (beta-lactamase class C family)
MRVPSHFIGACLALLLSCNAFAGTGFDKDRLALLDSRLDRYVEDGQLAGGVLYVSQGGNVVVHKAFGWQDIEAQVPMQKRSLHRIASQTKALTSVAIMMLVEQGDLLINDPLSKYFPEWENTTVAVADDKVELGYRLEPAQRSITIRDLLTHTAGVNYGWGLALTAWQEAGIIGWYFAADEEPLREKIRRMASLPHAAHPGDAFVYGYSTDILGALVEHISGQSLGKFLKIRLFDPLNMADTHFFVPLSAQSRLTTVYASAEAGLERQAEAKEITAPERDSFYFGQGHYLQGQIGGTRSHSGGAGAVSTAADYGRFLEMLRLGGTIDGRRILGRKTIELMTTNHLAPNVHYRPGSGFGLGFNISLDTGQAGTMGTAGSYGWGGAYHSNYWVDPVEDIVVSYVTQLIPADSVDDHEKIRTLIYQALGN